MLKRAKTLMEQTEQTETDKAPSAKRQRERSFETAVTKALNDNFKGLSEAEMNLTLIDGMSLRDRVADAKRRQKAGEKITLGKGFYNQLREQYGGVNSVSRQLRVKDDTEPEDQKMQECLMLMLRHNRDSNPITQWLLFSDLCSQKNFVGCCRAFLMISPQQSIANAKLVLDFARYVARTKAHEVFHDEWTRMRPHVDCALQKSYSHMKAQSVSTSVWWASVKEVGAMVLPADDVDRLLKCETSWGEVREELKRVSAASPVGRRMFAAASRQLTENEASDLIQKAADSLDGKDITEALVDTTQRKLVHDLELAGMSADATFPRRQVNFSYRGVALRTSVHSLLDEWSLRKEAKIREIAVKAGKLPALWCEDDLAAPSPALTVDVQAELLEAARRMRAVATDMLPSMPQQTSENIKEIVSKKQAVLGQLDRHSRIESLFFEAHIGEKAERRMQTSILACLPVKAGDVRTIAECKQLLKVLGEGKLFAFCGAGLQASWSTVYSLVQCLSEGRSPPWHQGGGGEFWTSVQGACANFLSTRAGASAGSADVPALYGAAAAAAQMQTLLDRKKDGEGNMRYGDLSNLLRFKWLLTAEHQKLLDGWVSDSLAQPAMVEPSSESKNSRNSKKQKSQDIKTLVSGLFK